MANQGDFHWINRRHNQWEDQWEHPYEDEFNNAIRNMRDGILNISNKRLTKLPRLPEGVKILICYNSRLKQITEPLPQSLQEIDFSFLYHLEELPNLQTNTNLKSLKCVSCRIKSLPALPDSLEILDVSETLSLKSLYPPVDPSSPPPTFPSKLQSLNCKATNISKLPPLQEGLVSLDCSFNTHITTIPPLPTTLRELFCNVCNIQSLPPLHTTSLTSLSCGNNTVLNVLPELPKTIKSIYCNNTSILSFPPLPNGLTIFECFSIANLTRLPALPDTLEILTCSSCKLESLPDGFPPSLKVLNCELNHSIQNLQTLPVGLQILYCGYTNIPSLPKLPITLQELHCQNTPIEELPTPLPQLTVLECNNTNISVLPDLPITLTEFDCMDCPLEPPYERMYTEFLEMVEQENNQVALQEFIHNINTFNSELRNLRSRGRNIESFRTTMNRPVSRFPPVSTGPVSEESNNPSYMLPYGPTTVIGEFLSGMRGTLENQSKQLRNTYTKTMKNKQGGSRRARAHSKRYKKSKSTRKIINKRMKTYTKRKFIH